jgi:hypothetical protein
MPFTLIICAGKYFVAELPQVGYYAIGDDAGTARFVFAQTQGACVAGEQSSAAARKECGPDVVAHIVSHVEYFRRRDSMNPMETCQGYFVDTG